MSTATAQVTTTRMTCRCCHCEQSVEINLKDWSWRHFTDGGEPLEPWRKKDNHEPCLKAEGKP